MVKEAEMEEHQARCNEIQVLKFGQLIDLEMVDKVCASAYVFSSGVSSFVDNTKNIRYVTRVPAPAPL